jgi:hypothetical protein
VAGLARGTDLGDGPRLIGTPGDLDGERQRSCEGLHPPVEPPDLGAGDLHSWVVEQQVPGRRHQRGVRTGARDEHDLKRL